MRGGQREGFTSHLSRLHESGPKEHLNPYQAIDGYTRSQRFFISYAQNWCENSRPEAGLNRVLTDPHAPNSLPVNGVS
jgi:putative endopeptidase